MHGIIVERVSCLVHGLDNLHCVWCVFQGWDVGTLGNTLSGCITQYTRTDRLTDRQTDKTEFNPSHMRAGDN